MDATAISALLDSSKDTTIMDKDRVRVAQVKSYLELLPQVAEILPEVPPNAHGTRAGVSQENSVKLNALMAELPKSHRWVKGLVAVYIAATHGPQES